MTTKDYIFQKIHPLFFLFSIIWSDKIEKLKYFVSICNILLKIALEKTTTLSAMTKIKFTKMHGAGNDYIYVNTMQHTVAAPAQAAKTLSDRHKGIGADGLVLIGTSPVSEADFSMRIFNADGSEATMCGNASRCIGKYLYERGLTNKKSIRLLTLSGIKTLMLKVDDGVVSSVTVDMQEPATADPSLYRPDRKPCDGVFVSMGNPHYIIFTDNIDQVGRSGPMLERNSAFPQRCNIEFAQIIDSRTIRVRVWERGSGITMACGTGACATAVAACIAGHTGRLVSIIMDGGTLTTEWREADNHVYLTGPAQFVFDGEITL